MPTATNGIIVAPSTSAPTTVDALLLSRQDWMVQYLSSYFLG